jgi:hypothetical protein
MVLHIRLLDNIVILCSNVTSHMQVSKTKSKENCKHLKKVMITIDGVKGKHGKCTTTYIYFIPTLTRGYINTKINGPYIIVLCKRLSWQNMENILLKNVIEQTILLQQMSWWRNTIILCEITVFCDLPSCSLSVLLPMFHNIHLILLISLLYAFIKFAVACIKLHRKFCQINNILRIG